MFIHQPSHKRHRALLSIAICIAILSLSLLSSCESDVSRYTINLDANGGEGTMDAINLKEGEATTLPACTFTKSGNVCAGWSTAKDATSAEFAAGSSFTIGGQDVTLYAI